MKALVTGFEPFGELRENPSWEAVKQISERLGKNVEVEKMLLPVEYDRSAELLLEKAAEYSPDVILCIGVAADRCALTPEYVAVNVKDCSTPDNAGKAYSFERIIDEGDSALYTNLPMTDVLDAVCSTGVPVAPSFQAGTYVCNDLFYHLMHDIKYNGRRIYGGFIHVPSETAVSVKDAARAIEAVLLMLADKPQAKPYEMK